MYVQVILMLACLSLTALAGERDFRTCSKSGMVVIYINGIMTSRDKATSDRNLLAKRVETNYRNEAIDLSGVEYDLSYNSSDVVPKGTLSDNAAPFVTDLWESIMFALNEQGERKTAALWTSIYLKLGGARLNRITGLDLKDKIEEVVRKFNPAYNLNSRDAQLAAQNLEAMTKRYFSQGKKVLHVAHSQGGFIAGQVATKILGYTEYSENKNLYGAVFLGTPISALPRTSEKGQFSYLSSHQDLVVKWVGTSLPSNIDVPGTLDGHGVIETYLSELPANSQGEFYRVSRFLYNKIRASVSTFDNNDESCCNKEDGKFWRNDDDCTGDACLGGFVSNDVSLAEKEVNVDLGKGSMLCGEALIDEGYDTNLTLADNSRIDGKVTVRGNVFLSGSSVIGNDKGQRVNLWGGQGNRQGLILAQDVEITGSPLIEGDLTITQAKIIGNGTYRGTARYAGDYLVSPLLTGGSGVNRVFSGNNNISGTYVIDTNLHDVTVEGGFQLHPVYDWITFNLYGSVGTGATIKGVGGSTGTIGPGVTVHGITYGSTDTGAGIDETSQIKGNSTAKGSFLLSVSSKIEDSDYEMNQVDGTNVSLVTGNSTIKNANVFGLGGLFGSNVIGGSINASRFFIKNATLNNVTVSGSNIALCRQIFNGGSFGSNTSEGDCSLATAKQLPEVSRYLASRQEMFKRRYFKVMDRIQEIKQTTR